MHVFFKVESIDFLRIINTSFKILKIKIYEFSRKQSAVCFIMIVYIKWYNFVCERSYLFISNMYNNSYFFFFFLW